jgi:hypothetical protein
MFIVFHNICNFLNKINEIIGLAMNGEANVKIEFVNQRISNRRLFMEPIYVDNRGWLYVLNSTIKID